VASALLGHTERDVVVHMRGGDLRVCWDERDGHMHMTGPAERVFEGSWQIM
jgi:diaminopimelate epimerase